MALLKRVWDPRSGWTGGSRWGHCLVRELVTSGPEKLVSWREDVTPLLWGDLKWSKCYLTTLTGLSGSPPLTTKVQPVRTSVLLNCRGFTTCKKVGKFVWRSSWRVLLARYIFWGEKYTFADFYIWGSHSLMLHSDGAMLLPRSPGEACQKGQTGAQHFVCSSCPSLFPSQRLPAFWLLALNPTSLL